MLKILIIKLNLKCLLMESQYILEEHLNLKIYFGKMQVSILQKSVI